MSLVRLFVNTYLSSFLTSLITLLIAPTCYLSFPSEFPPLVVGSMIPSTYLDTARTNVLQCSSLYQMVKNYSDMEGKLDVFCTNRQEIRALLYNLIEYQQPSRHENQ
jgi:hypothetical protein